MRVFATAFSRCLSCPAIGGEKLGGAFG
jgi:hypothetical protein